MSIIENCGAPLVTPARLVDAIHRHPDRSPALIAGDRTISYGELTERVRHRLRELALSDRSVVVLSGTNSAEFVVTYLALLDAGHVPLLAAPGDAAAQLTAAWSPAATVAAGDHDVDIDHHIDEHADHHIDQHTDQHTDRHGADTGASLHPDLALLLSTSGSTGSPKLVRLSQRNLVANAASIVEYLQITTADRGITTLPLHYCYGLSVLHSHLLAGASVVLTDASVVDPCFRRALTDHAVTNVAGVPHTYEMLDRSGHDGLYVPSLRLLTQAGGRMDPADVARWVDRSAGCGVDFYVMYGQTEATARMAYLPPDLAARRPGTIGRPIPGGTLRLDPVAEFDEDDRAIRGADDDGGGDTGSEEIGELVYAGDNVMMGYATGQDDLARGHDLDELRTGDLARFHPDDQVYEIVGRRARFVKPFGLRIDLDELERRLADRLTSPGGDGDTVDRDPVAVAGTDSVIVVAAPTADRTVVVEAVTDLTGLPASRVVLDRRSGIPRLASGKVDYAALLDAAPDRRVDPRDVAAGDTSIDEQVVADDPVDTTTRIRRIYAVVLGRHDVTVDDTFVSLGGDSLSYVECAIRLEQVLGDVPPDWHLTPISALGTGRRRRWLPRVDTTLVLRALAICLIVGTHMHVWFFPGGAHLLLAVVGYNLARFVAPVESTRDRVVAGLRTAARAAVPAMLWAGAGVLVFGAYSLGTALLVNNYVGPASHADDHWHFWFIEVFVHLVVLTTLLLAIPAVRRTERRWPYLFSLGLLGVTLVLRMEWAWMGDWYNIRYRTHAIAWFFVLGWLVRQSVTLPQRLLTTVVCFTVVPGFFQYPPREWFIAGALVVLLWAREIPVPRPLVRPVALLAAASLWIYITHFTFWPLLTDVFVREVAYVLTILSGVAVWAGVRVVTTRWSGRSGREAALAPA